MVVKHNFCAGLHEVHAAWRIHRVWNQGNFCIASVGITVGFDRIDSRRGEP